MSLASMAYKIPRICGDCNGMRQADTNDAKRLTEYRETVKGEIVSQRTRTICSRCEDATYNLAAELNDISERCDAQPMYRTFTVKPF